ncbi:hypothetical protein DICPUDRAFT_81148 [Dictyostelium purpureum]|uniref:C2 domain-containing protein n=1 Tax=Dictyostelium purpureum TaxID=5786 RepID=F0ZSM6_DICPU|nr:uncharacterized protein DICPUDRAFT_81148 [Dictyostelium purpureum]EGC33062.1 hypothetical protein DICPUDRAFT_81148 [Dictyostelium purpureum]|eukprot:XP_003290412.1 hypothetical protein DICPUDRAFT_81148 [Dictyostelium purpureum]
MSDIYGDILKAQQKQGNLGGKAALDEAEKRNKANEKNKAPKDKEGDWTYNLYIDNGIVLDGTDGNGLSDPYVVLVALGPNNKSKQVYRSSVQKKTLEPSWSEKGTMKFKDTYTQLRVELWDQDIIGRNDFIGSNIIDVKNHGAAQKFDTEVYKEKDGSKDLTGSVKFQFEKVGASIIGTGKFGAY